MKISANMLTSQNSIITTRKWVVIMNLKHRMKYMYLRLEVSKAIEEVRQAVREAKDEKKEVIYLSDYY